MFTVTVETGNAAFMPDAAPEIARLLREVADRLEDNLPRYSEASGASMDYNGNRVLEWRWTGRERRDDDDE